MALAYSVVLYNFLTSYSAPIIALYLLMVISTRFLTKLFSPFDLRRVLMAHNLICSTASFYAVVCFIIGFWHVRDLFSLEQQREGVLHHGFLVYWLSKLYELLDTVFMLLRHKRRQMSFLHVFHHSSITMLADWAFFLSPIPAVAPILALNSMVHVVMYGYYFLTALYPLRDFVWKKRITQLQIVQFVLGLWQAVMGYLYHGFCVYAMLYALSMIVLFSNFYYRAFIVKRGRRSAKAEVGGVGTPKEDDTEKKKL